MEYLFSFDGRVDRQAYWTSWAIGLVSSSATLIVIAFLMDAQTRGDNTGGLAGAAIVTSLISLFVSISVLSFHVRRWHDLDRSGWWALITLVPLLGALYSFGMLGFVPGTDGSNSYGDPQLRDHAEGGAVKKPRNSDRYEPRVSAKRAAEIERKTVV